jgi:hypothetical protein
MQRCQHYRCCRPVVNRNLYRRYLSRFKGRFEISGLLRQLGWIDAPNTQNFEILKYLEQTQESRKIKITIEFFVKMLDGSILVKDVFYDALFELFFRI